MRSFDEIFQIRSRCRLPARQVKMENSQLARLLKHTNPIRGREFGLGSDHLKRI